MFFGLSALPEIGSILKPSAPEQMSFLEIANGPIRLLSIVLLSVAVLRSTYSLYFVDSNSSRSDVFINLSALLSFILVMYASWYNEANVQIATISHLGFAILLLFYLDSVVKATKDLDVWKHPSYASILGNLSVCVIFISPVVLQPELIAIAIDDKEKQETSLVYGPLLAVFCSLFAYNTAQLIALPVYRFKRKLPFASNLVSSTTIGFFVSGAGSALLTAVLLTPLSLPLVMLMPSFDETQSFLVAISFTWFMIFTAFSFKTTLLKNCAVTGLCSFSHSLTVCSSQH